MILERFEVPGLAHYSYAVGCSSAGEVAVVDPERAADTYLDWAASRDLGIAHVLETHIHADYASGARELARRAGADLHLSRYDEGELFDASYAHTEIGGDDALDIGSVRLVARHTPGHTPEHVSFLVYDTLTSSSRPCALLSGDFLFVGSLGRPDLLGEESKRRLASDLYASTRRALDELDDEVRIYPAHGAGSMCGAGMSGLPSSTFGLERRTNPYLDPDLSEEEFVARILGSAPPFPPYYRRMKRVNADGPPGTDELPQPDALSPEDFRSHMDEGAVVVDVRSPDEFGRGHVPDSFGIGLGPGLATWAAWVVPYETPILLVLPDATAEMAAEAVRWLRRVGLDLTEGWLEGGMPAWTQSGGAVQELAQLEPAQLQDRLAAGDALRVLDVRTDEEWAAGHIDGAIHIPGGGLAERIEEIPAEHGNGAAPLAVVCGSGYRSTVAASVLERAGHTDLTNVPGGMGAWMKAGLPVESD